MIINWRKRFWDWWNVGHCPILEAICVCRSHKNGLRACLGDYAMMARENPYGPVRWAACGSRIMIMIPASWSANLMQSSTSVHLSISSLIPLTYVSIPWCPAHRPHLWSRSDVLCCLLTETTDYRFSSWSLFSNPISLLLLSFSPCFSSTFLRVSFSCVFSRQLCAESHSF